MLTKTFWADTVKRVIGTFAYTALAILGSDEFGLFNAPWQDAVSAAGMAAVLAFLAAVAAGSGVNPANLKNPKLSIPSPTTEASTAAAPLAVKVEEKPKEAPAEETAKG